MNTNRVATLGTIPSGLLGSNEMPYTEFPYALKIVDHAHTILSSIALIQMSNAGTGKAIATEAILESTLHYLLTVLNSARHAELRFLTVIAPTTRACLYVDLIWPISTTEMTVHSTGGD